MSALLLSIAALSLTASGVRAQTSDWSLEKRSGDVFYIDTPKDLFGMYAAFSLRNEASADWENVTATFTLDPGSVALADREDGVVSIGRVAAGQSVMAYFYLKAGYETDDRQYYTVTIAYEDETGTAQGPVVETFDFEEVQETIAARANKVYSATTFPELPVAGQPLVITVHGATGELGDPQELSFTPAAYVDWPADALQLVSTEIEFTGGNEVTWTDQLFGELDDPKNSPYTATYIFRIDGGFDDPVPISPIGYISSGTQIKHTDTGNFGELPPVEPPIVPDHMDLELTLSADNDTPPEGSTVTYTIEVANEPIPGRDPLTATGVEVFTYVPVGTPIYPDAYLPAPNGQATQGTYDFDSHTWSVGTLAPGASATLTLVVWVPTPDELATYGGTDQRFWAEVSAADQLDIDSTPGNYPVHEDDDDEVTLSPTSGGGNGGIESNPTMARQLAQLLFDRRRAAESGPSADPAPFTAYDAAAKNAAGSSEELLRLVIPEDGPQQSTAWETSPRDLLPITNADDVVAVDFVRDTDGLRVGAFFGALTTGELYEHTKVICDRLRGGVLGLVGPTTVIGRPFLVSRIDHADGTVDYAISMNVFRSGAGFVVDSRFRLDEYDRPMGGDDVLNLQVWSQSPEFTTELAERVLRRLEEHGPVIYRNEWYNPPAVPGVYVRTGQYREGRLELELFNGTGATSIRLTGGSYSLTERGDRTTFERDVLLPAADEHGIVRVTLPLGPVFDATFFVETPEGDRDQMYLADGAWSYSFDGAGARVGRFGMVPQEHVADKYGFYTVERTAAIAGEVRTWAVLYRYLKANGQPVDLSGYGYAEFTASGNGQVRVLFEKASVTDTDHYGTTVQLTSEPKTYRFWYDDLRRQDGSGRLSADDLVLVSFTVYGDQYNLKPFDIKVSDLRFGGGEGDPLAEVPDAFELKQNYPNPFNPQTRISYGVPSSGQVRLVVYDVLGRPVTTLVDGFRPEGRHTVTFDGSRLASGMYLYRLEAGERTVTRTMTLLR